MTIRVTIANGPLSMIVPAAPAAAARLVAKTNTAPAANVRAGVQTVSAYNAQNHPIDVPKIWVSPQKANVPATTACAPTAGDRRVPPANRDRQRNRRRDQRGDRLVAAGGARQPDLQLGRHQQHHGERRVEAGELTFSRR